MGFMPIFYLCCGVFMASIQERLTELFEPAVSALGCELWGLEYLTQGRRALLRVYIDKAGGVGVEDCERVSRQVSSLLDVEDPIRSEYTLEVSSPGMDRPLFRLEQFQANVGERVALRLRQPFEGRRKFTGLLKTVENEEIVLEVDDEEYLLPYELIDKANVVPQF
jgi:ribosome maturation factor RimP